MLRSIYSRINGGVCASLALWAALTTSHAVAGVKDTQFEVLGRPALAKAKIASSAIIAVAGAGKRMVAVGERGIVLLSDDNGGTWRQAQVPVSTTLTAVQFVDERNGWATGHLGVVLHSVDGGEHWSIQFDGIRAAVIAKQSAQDAKQIAAAQMLIEDGPDKPFLDLYFKDKTTGYIVGAYGLVFRTDDGGRTWRSWMGHLANPKNLHLYAIKAVDGAMYVAGEQGLLLRSTDDGENFIQIESPSKGTYFGLLSGKNGQLLVYGLRGRAFWSGDGALSWTEVTTQTNASISAGVRNRDGRMMLASQAGELLVSRDDGRTFEKVPQVGGSPITGLAESPTGVVVASTLRGIHRIEPRSKTR